MSDQHSVDIDRHVRAYILVFVALMALTVITVGVYYLHLPIVPAVALALTIATIKGSLVACVFMHLISEKALVYWVLGLTAVFFLALMFFPLLTSLIEQTGR